MAIVLVHIQSPDELARRFWVHTRTAYDENDKRIYHRNIAWLRNRILAGDVTSTQARNAYNTTFGTSIDATTWSNVYVPRFNDIADLYTTYIGQGWID